MRPARDLEDDFLIQGMTKFGKTAIEAKTILALGQQRLGWTSDVRRGYAGWITFPWRIARFARCDVRAASTPART